MNQDSRAARNMWIEQLCRIELHIFDLLLCFTGAHRVDLRLLKFLNFLPGQPQSDIGYSSSKNPCSRIFLREIDRHRCKSNRIKEGCTRLHITLKKLNRPSSISIFLFALKAHVSFEQLAGFFGFFWTWNFVVLVVYIEGCRKLQIEQHCLHKFMRICEVKWEICKSKWPQYSS